MKAPTTFTLLVETQVVPSQQNSWCSSREGQERSSACPSKMMQERARGSCEAPCIAQNGDRSKHRQYRRRPKQALVQGEPEQNENRVAINSQLQSSVQ